MYFTSQSHTHTQGELDGLMRQHPYLVHPRQQKIQQQHQQQQQSYYGIEQHTPTQQMQYPPQQQQQSHNSYSSYQSNQRYQSSIPSSQQHHHHQQQQQQTHSVYHNQQSQQHQQHNIMIPNEMQRTSHSAVGESFITPERSFSSSEDELRSTPDFDGESRIIKIPNTNSILLCLVILSFLFCFFLC